MSSQGSGEDTTFLDMLASVVGDETPAGPSSLQRQSSSSSLDLTALFAMDDIPATPSQPAAPRGNSNENSNSRQRMLQHQQLHQQQIQQQMQQQQTPQQRIIAHPLSAILAQLPPDRHPAFMAIYQQFHNKRISQEVMLSKVKELFLPSTASSQQNNHTQQQQQMNQQRSRGGTPTPSPALLLQQQQAQMQLAQQEMQRKRQAEALAQSGNKRFKQDVSGLTPQMFAAMTPQQRAAALDQMPAWMRAQFMGNSRNASQSGSPQLLAQQHQQQLQQQLHMQQQRYQQQQQSSNNSTMIQLPPTLSNNTNNGTGFRNSHAPRMPSHLSSNPSSSKLNQETRDSSPLPSNIQAPSQSSKTTERPPVDVNKLDVDSMMDATTYGGIDLKEEEYTMEFSNTSGSASKRGSVSKEAPFLNQHRLKKEVQKIVMEYGIRNVDIKILEYISQAAESRVNELLEPMIQVSRHRTGVTSSQILSEERKMKSGYELKVSSKNTVKKTLDDLEKQELALETELKAELPEEGEEVLSDTPDGKKKKYKPISKKELPDNIKQKMINTTALLAAGGEMKSWMMGAGSDPSSSGLLKSFPVKSKTAASSRKRKDESAEKPSDPALKGMRVMQKDRITLKDAMAALETDPHLPRTSLFYKWLSQLR